MIRMSDSNPLQILCTPLVMILCAVSVSAQQTVEYSATRSDESYPEYHGSTKNNPGYLDGNSSIVEKSDYYGSYPEAKLKPVFRPEYSEEGSYRQPRSILRIGGSDEVLIATKSGELFRMQKTAAEDKERFVRIFAKKNAKFGEMLQLADDAIAVCDEGNDSVWILKKSALKNSTSRWIETARIDTPGLPNDLCWDRESSRLFVSVTWGQRLYVCQALSPKLTIWQLDSVDLPMCAGELLYLPKHDSVLVVDAFGRDFAVVSTDDWQVKKHAQLYGHNISELVLTEDQEMLFFPHQLLNEYARSVTTNITWGGLMSNNIRWLRIDRLLTEDGIDMFKKAKFYPLGTPGNGAGDPSSMAVSSNGRLAVTLAGTNRVAVQEKGQVYFWQAEVGYRPIDCVYSADETKLFVLNQFSDNVSVVDLETRKVVNWSLGPLRSPTEEERGEQLFFSSLLAHDAWMSCHSCHSQGHTNGQLNDNFTDTSFGTPKRVLSLLGQSKTMPYAWAGSMESLEDQVAHSVVSTMAGKKIPKQSVEAIAAYVRSLPKPPSLAEFRKRDEHSRVDATVQSIKHGKRTFRKLGCADCHSGKQFTSPVAYDVGLYDEESMREFNPPSLIAVSQRQNSLLHDGRAKSIRDVLVKENHQLQQPLSDADLNALVDYLQSL